MVERGRGAVVNIGSGSTEAIPSFPLYSVYAASKRYDYHVRAALRAAIARHTWVLLC
jgi:short-subunit dehydrogenase